MGDSRRFCLNCDQLTRWHKSWGVPHSQCKVCGMPSLFGVKEPLWPAKIEMHRVELRFMLGYNGQVSV